MPRFIVDRLGRLVATGAAMLQLSAEIRRAGVLRALPLVTLGIVLTCAQPERARAEGLPDQFDSSTCYQLVRETGRIIAWARWEEGFPLEKTRKGQFREDTPVWMSELVQNWITDAYQWQATDEQIRQLAMELGYAGELPRVDQLNTRQTMNLWMQRIAHNCDEQV